MKIIIYSILFSFAVFCSACTINAQETKNDDAWRRIDSWRVPMPRVTVLSGNELMIDGSRVAENQENAMRKILSLMALCLLVLPIVGKAQVTSVTGNATVVSPPPSVVATGTGLESIVFAEQSGVLSSSISVDASKAGSYGFFGAGSLTPGTIAAGTDVSSFYLHSWDSTNLSGTIYSGSITFATPILGVEALDASLVATNSILGVPTTTYYTTEVGQGFEGSTQIDGFTISGDTLSFIDETFNAPDDLRIITAAPTAAPEPSGVLMLGMGLLALMVFNLKRLIA